MHLAAASGIHTRLYRKCHNYIDIDGGPNWAWRSPPQQQEAETTDDDRPAIDGDDHPRR
jgi:hypothetical protein